MTDNKAAERMARKRQRDREKGWIEVPVKIHTKRKHQLKEMVAKWMEEDIKPDEPRRIVSKKQYEWEGKHYSLTELAHMHGLSGQAVSARMIRQGLSLKDALTNPVGKSSGRPRWNPDAKLKAEVEYDWLENRDLSADDVAAKHGVSCGTLLKYFGTRRFRNGLDDRRKREAKVDWTENLELSEAEVAEKYGISTFTLRKHFGNRKIRRGRPSKQPLRKTEDVDL